MFGSVVHPIKSNDDIDISGKGTKHYVWVLMVYVTEVYLKPSLPSTTELFSENLKKLKSFIVDVGLVSKYASAPSKKRPWKHCKNWVRIIL